MLPSAMSPGPAHFEHPGPVKGIVLHVDIVFETQQKPPAHLPLAHQWFAEHESPAGLGFSQEPRSRHNPSAQLYAPQLSPTVGWQHSKDPALKRGKVNAKQRATAKGPSHIGLFSDGERKREREREREKEREREREESHRLLPAARKYTALLYNLRIH